MFLNIDIPSLAAALRECESRHAVSEKRLPKHEWPEWYAAFLKEFNAQEAPLAAEMADEHIKSLQNPPFVPRLDDFYTAPDGTAAFV